MSIAGLAISEADGQIFVRGQPHAERAPVDPAALLCLIAEAGFADCEMDVAALEHAAQEANTRPTPFALQVGLKRDAGIHVEVAQDAMQASVTLTPAKGGRPASVEDIIAALMEAGVYLGMDRKALMEACQDSSTGPVVVAHGEAPQEGVDSSFVELLAESSDRAPKVNEDGLIDYRELGALPLVQPGMPLMRRVPAVPGVPGRNVRGETIDPRPVRDEPFAMGLAGAAVSTEDPLLLTAAIAGAPVRVAAGVLVEPVLRVKEVNLATGNLYFDGTVEVAGDVTHHMKVETTGDIFVSGTVEGGTLMAQGNITVKGGVIAASSLHAKGSISARFAQDSTLDAGTVLALDDSALDCTLSSLNQIRVGLKSPQRGRLIGGSATAKLLVEAPVIGADKSGTTRILVGFDPELEARFKALEERIAQEKTNEENLHKVCSHLVAIKDPKGMLERARAAWRQATQAWGKSLVQRTEIQKERAVMLNARLTVKAQTGGTIDLTFGTQRLVLRKEYGKGYFSIDRDGRMVFTTPDGKALPAT